MEVDFRLVAKRLQSRIEQNGDAAEGVDSPVEDYLVQTEEINLEPLLTMNSEPAHPDTELVHRIQTPPRRRESG